MRINLKCPYAEKDEAKQLGARWDASLKVWYIVDVEDLTPFMRWIRWEGPGETVTLSDYLKRRYKGHISLTRQAARAFDIPYPLKSGWAKLYAGRQALVSALKDRPVKERAARPLQHDLPIPQIVVSSDPLPRCDCETPPWEDCAHTAWDPINDFKAAMAR